MYVVDSVRTLVEVVESLASSYDLNKLHRALLYSILDYSLAKKGVRGREELLAGLTSLSPPILRALVKAKLEEPLGRFVEASLKLLESRAVVLDSLASLDYVLKLVTNTVRRVDNVMIFDALSPIELVVIAGYLRSRGFKTVVPDTVFINPVGLTRFLTAQRGGQSTLRDVASYIAGILSAKGYFKSSYVDERVHSVGYVGVEEFARSVDVRLLAESIEGVASSGSTLILSDHGYDIVWDRETHYLLVTHGFKEGKPGYEVVTPLSRIAIPLIIHKG
jgi:hypothetical protein